VIFGALLDEHRRKFPDEVIGERFRSGCSLLADAITLDMVNNQSIKISFKRGKKCKHL